MQIVDGRRTIEFLSALKVHRFYLQCPNETDVQLDVHIYVGFYFQLFVYNEIAISFNKNSTT